MSTLSGHYGFTKRSASPQSEDKAFPRHPDLIHDNPALAAAVIRIMRFWLDLGANGLRPDAIRYLCVRKGTPDENPPETHAAIKLIRTAIDASYADRMLLAEANRWPEDVREYFGDKIGTGDNFSLGGRDSGRPPCNGARIATPAARTPTRSVYT